MSMMCALASCKAKSGMCGHEKIIVSIALLAVIVAVTLVVRHFA
jgi:hypothetical protein